jgi:hypothetical protein
VSYALGAGLASEYQQLQAERREDLASWVCEVIHPAQLLVLGCNVLGGRSLESTQCCLRPGYLRICRGLCLLYTDGQQQQSGFSRRHTWRLCIASANVLELCFGAKDYESLLMQLVQGVLAILQSL